MEIVQLMRLRSIKSIMFKSALIARKNQRRIAMHVAQINKKSNDNLVESLKNLLHKKVMFLNIFHEYLRHYQNVYICISLLFLQETTYSHLVNSVRAIILDTG